MVEWDSFQLKGSEFCQLYQSVVLEPNSQDKHAIFFKRLLIMAISFPSLCCYRMWGAISAGGKNIVVPVFWGSKRRLWLQIVRWTLTPRSSKPIIIDLVASVQWRFSGRHRSHCVLHRAVTVPMASIYRTGISSSVFPCE